MCYRCDKCGKVMARIGDVGFLVSPDDEGCSPFATLACLCPDCTKTWNILGWILWCELLERSDNSRELI